MIVRDVIEAKKAKNEPPSVLNSWVQPCGTYGCVGGDTFIAMYPEYTGDYDGIGYGANRLSLNFEHIFGFSPWFNDDGKLSHVFGASDDATLQQRLDYVESQLALNEYGS